jgi:hypothetical protein
MAGAGTALPSDSDPGAAWDACGLLQAEDAPALLVKLAFDRHGVASGFGLGLLRVDSLEFLMKRMLQIAR